MEIQSCINNDSATLHIENIPRAQNLQLKCSELQKYCNYNHCSKFENAQMKKSLLLLLLQSCEIEKLSAASSSACCEIHSVNQTLLHPPFLLMHHTRDTSDAPY